MIDDMACEMCGSKEGFYRALIEGTEMKVCAECSKFGKVLGAVKKEEEPKKKGSAKVAVEQSPEVIEMIVPDFSDKIKNKRSALSLDQENFALLINEKKSVVHNLENGDLKPSIELARKLEKKLNLKLVEAYEDKKQGFSKDFENQITVGDLIKIKQRKSK